MTTILLLPSSDECLSYPDKLKYIECTISPCYKNILNENYIDPLTKWHICQTIASKILFIEFTNLALLYVTPLYTKQDINTIKSKTKSCKYTIKNMN